METEIIDKLYLELAQFTTAKTPYEVDNERLRRIVKVGIGSLARLECRPQGGEPHPISGVLWGKVAWVFGLGSTRSCELCREFGFDPESKVE